MSYPGEDQMIGTLDDGRSRMLAYEEIPFRIEQGEIPFILGDNFSSMPYWRTNGISYKLKG